jgi:hypothetical protein
LQELHSSGNPAAEASADRSSWRRRRREESHRRYKGNERVERRPYVPVGWTSRLIGVRFEPVDVLEVRQPREHFRPTRVPSEVDRLDQKAEMRVHQDRLPVAFRVNRVRVDVIVEQALSLGLRTVQ